MFVKSRIHCREDSLSLILFLLCFKQRIDLISKLANTLFGIRSIEIAKVKLLESLLIGLRDILFSHHFPLVLCIKITE